MTSRLSRSSNRPPPIARPLVSAETYDQRTASDPPEPAPKISDRDDSGPQFEYDSDAVGTNGDRGVGEDGGGGDNCEEGDRDYGQDRDERHQGEYEEEVEEEDEEAVITCLRQELESRRNQTRVAIESSWKEVERLWLERAASADRIEGLETNMEDLQRDIEDLNDAREGGYLSRALAEAKDEAIACKEDRIASDRDSREEYIDSFRYNSDSVRMLDSVGIIEPDASQNRTSAGVGKATNPIWSNICGGRGGGLTIWRGARS